MIQSNKNVRHLTIKPNLYHPVRLRNYFREVLSDMHVLGHKKIGFKSVVDNGARTIWGGDGGHSHI